MIFTPILKTKQSSEYHALCEMLTIIKSKQNIIPYIESIKSISNKCVLKYIDILRDTTLFFEPIESDVQTVLDCIDSFPLSCILVLRVRTNTTLEEINNFIDKNNKSNRIFGIKIDDADIRYFDFAGKMTNPNYLFVELNGTSYISSSFLDDLKADKPNCNVIIHSNEREHYVKGKDFKDHDFNLRPNFNFSIVESIKNGTFSFDGFGSRCSAKNDNTEDVKIARQVTGVFLIYDFNENNFYTIKSDEEGTISFTYYKLKEKLIREKPFIDSLFLNNTPIAKQVLTNYLTLEKFSCLKLITVSIVRYIEEIIYNLL